MLNQDAQRALGRPRREMTMRQVANKLFDPREGGPAIRTESMNLGAQPNHCQGSHEPQFGICRCKRIATAKGEAIAHL